MEIKEIKTENIFQQDPMQCSTWMVSMNSSLTVFLPMAASMVFQQGKYG